jgi:small subunit ribosomal protein S17
MSEEQIDNITEQAPPADASQGHPRRAKVGKVTSISGEKTLSVIVDNVVKHPQYGKYLRRRTKMAVHDEHNTAGVGDTVEILPCRRMSKSKSYRLARVIRPAEARS